MKENRQVEIKECGTLALLTAIGAGVGAIASAPKAGEVVRDVVDKIRGK